MSTNLARNPLPLSGPPVARMLLCAVLCLAATAAHAVSYSQMLYDDTFQNMWADGSWRAKVDPKHDMCVYNGSYAMEVTLEAKGAVCFKFASGIDLISHYAVVGWIHGGTEGGQDLRVVATDADGNILPTSRGLPLASGPYIRGGAIAPERWQFFVVPLSHLRLARRSITRIAFYNPTDKAMPTFYLDDVGFTAQRIQLFAEIGVQEKAPVDKPELTAHAIYDDALANDWENTSWGTTVDLANLEHAAQGTHSILAEQEPGGGLAFGQDDAFSTTGYSALEFYVHGGTAGGQALQVSMFDESDQTIKAVHLNNASYIKDGTITGGQWQRVVVPLTDLGAANVNITKIAITNAASETALYYVDTVRLAR